MKKWQTTLLKLISTTAVIAVVQCFEDFSSKSCPLKQVPLGWTIDNICDNYRKVWRYKRIYYFVMAIVIKCFVNLTSKRCPLKQVPSNGPNDGTADQENVHPLLCWWQENNYRALLFSEISYSSHLT